MDAEIDGFSMSIDAGANAGSRNMPLRVLVMTNHFSHFAGSEVVALEAALWFANQGDAVTLAANVIGVPIKHHAAGITLTSDFDQIDPSEFDLIWCHHDMLSQLPLAVFERASRCRLPHIALVALSPYEPYEHVDGVLARALSADVYANSPETAEEIAQRNRGVIAPSSVRIFYNAAPAEFWRPAAAPPPSLRSLMLISNHAPPEALRALELLEQQGVGVRRMGLGHDFQLVRPADIAAADAIVTIGKSVIYAVAQRRPVFMYDHFGGDGWLTRANWESNLRRNFSGRAACRRLDADALAHEIAQGYAMAALDAASFADNEASRLLHLDVHLTDLRRRTVNRAASWRSRKLAFWLSRPRFRAHLAAAHHKSAVMRRSYRMLVPDS